MTVGASRRTVAQIGRYITVGTLSAGLETGLFWLLFRQIHTPWIFANSTAVFVTFWFNFFLNRVWSFDSRDPLARQLLLYGTLVGVNLIVSNAVIFLLADVGSLDHIIAKWISVIFIVMWNFVIFKKVIYRQSAG